MYPHNNDRRQLHPQRFPPLSPPAPRDTTPRPVNSMIGAIPNPAEPSRITQRQRNRKDDARSQRPQNGRCVSSIEVADARRLEEDQHSPRKLGRARMTQSVSPTTSPPSIRDIYSSAGYRRCRPRYEVVSMLEYLTLGQLEDIWQKQDLYNDYVDMPQRTQHLSPTIDDTQHTSSSRGVYQGPTRKKSGLSEH